MPRTRYSIKSRKKKKYLNDMANLSSVANIVANVAAAVSVEIASNSNHSARARTSHQGSFPGRKIRHRIRRSVEDHYRELGDLYFRRAYRMSYDAFTSLSALLRPGILDAMGYKGTFIRYKPNGPISPDVRLACAIRWFSGGSAYDIMTNFGISHTDETIRFQ
jgi:hypothetical protein